MIDARADTRLSYTFRLLPAERKALEKIVFQPPLPRWYVYTMVPVYGLQLFIRIFDRPRTVWGYVSIALAAVMIASIVAIVAYQARPRVASSGMLTMTEAGLTGTVDDRPLALPWREIAMARMIDGTIVLTRRGRARAIAIPKSAISDSAALWAFLDDRLVAKRNLVRPSGPRTIILNSVTPR